MVKEEEPKEVHEFWDTQPVPKDDGDQGEGPLEERTVESVKKESYAIASTFEWWVPNVEDDADVDAITILLRDNYVEDDSLMFRFNYSRGLLRWALAPPGYIPDWHVGVRRKTDGMLLAFVSGVPVTLKMGNQVKSICEINFLCVHKKLRKKRMAPILIKEVTRRVNLTGIWQAVYTVGKVLPTPFTSAQYFHRSLNPEKLIAVGFSRVPRQYEKFANPMAMVKRNFALPPKPQLKGLRPMTDADVPSVTALLCEYLKNFTVAVQFTEEDVRHWLVPKEGIVYSYVVERDKVTDFFSFYSLPSTIIGGGEHKMLYASYVFYHAETISNVKTLMNDLLIVSRDMGFDVCNCVDILNAQEFIHDLKFMPGDGFLHYYFYNWRFPKTPPNSVGLVML